MIIKEGKEKKKGDDEKEKNKTGKGCKGHTIKLSTLKKNNLHYTYNYIES